MTSKEMIKTYCGCAGWSPTDYSKDDYALFGMEFPAEKESGKIREVALTEKPWERGILYFTAFTSVRFEKLNSMVDKISTWLMIRNGSLSERDPLRQAGFWVLNDYENEKGTVTYAFELSHQCSWPALTQQLFEAYINNMIKELGEFDYALQTARGTSHQTSNSDELTNGILRGAGQKLGALSVEAIAKILAGSK